MSDFTTGYMTGSDYLRLAGIFCLHGNHAQTNCGSLTIVYHHDNSGDGDNVIAEAFCGAGRIGSKCGIFHDNDQVYINGECCSPH